MEQVWPGMFIILINLGNAFTIPFFLFSFLLMEGFLALYAQLGLGDCIDRNIPSPVSIGGCQLKNVACGWWHTLLLATTSTKLVKENRDEEQFC